MSLIVGQYYRGNPNQKPKRWGSYNHVQATVSNRAESLDINPKYLYFWPFQEGGGNLVIDVGLNGINGVVQAANWVNSGIQFGASTRPVVLDSNVSLSAEFHWYITAVVTIGLLSNTEMLLGKYDTDNYFGVKPTELAFQNNDSVNQNQNYTLLTGKKYKISLHLYPISKTAYPNDYEWIVNDVSCGIKDSVSGIDPRFIIDTLGNGYTSDFHFTGTCDYILILQRYVEDPYYLIQPPTFRTYFDLAEAGTTLSFTSINSNSDLNNNFLSAIKLLNPTNISCFTEISDSIISGLVNLISGNDLLADSQITQASIQAIRKLLGQEISSVSQITDIVISTAKQFNLTDLNSLTEVTNVVFSVINQINNNDLLSNSQVINLAIDVIRQININSIESISNITEVVLSITGGIRGIDVEAQTEITSLALSILKVLKENNVESNSSVNEATLNVIHQLDFNNISSLSEITDIVTVAGSNIGINDNNSLTQITQVILDIIKAVSPININIQSEIDNPIINVLRTLFSNTVNVISNVTSVGVTNISTIATGKVTITFSMAVPSISWSLE